MAYKRINVLLESCRTCLGASDARLALFADDSSTWVFLPSLLGELSAAPRAAGWGSTLLYGLLRDNPQSCAIIRGYHSPVPATASRALVSDATSYHRPWSTSQPVPRPVSASQPAPRACFGSQPIPQPPASGLTSANTRVLRLEPRGSLGGIRTTPPDAAALERKSLTQPVRIRPSDLLALPVYHEDRLVAALLLGLSPPAAPVAGSGTASGEGTGSSGPAPPQQGHQPLNADGGCDSTRRQAGAAGGDGAGEMEIGVGELSQLQRLAQLLAFGVLAEPRRARMLETIAMRLSPLPTAPSLHRFVSGLLDSIPELMRIRFGLTLQPILLLSHGLNTGAPAILFTKKPPLTQPATDSVGKGASAFPVSARGSDGLISATDPGPGRSGARRIMRQATSVLSLQAADQVDASDAFPTVKAVRMSLRQTLLAEALRSAAEEACAARDASAATEHPIAPTRTAQLTSVSISGAVAADGRCAGAAGPVAVAVAGSRCGQLATPAPISYTYHTTTVTDISSYMLKDGAACNDLLLCANLVGGSIGSVALCLQVPAPAAADAMTPSSGDTGTAAAALVAARASVASEDITVSVGSGGGGAAAGASSSAVTAAGAGAANAQSVLARAMLSQRQFGMYLLCAEPLPRPLLQEVAEELQQLLGMALNACTIGCGPLSLSPGRQSGRCSAELAALQQQALGLGPGTVLDPALALALAGASSGGASGGECGGGDDASSLLAGDGTSRSLLPPQRAMSADRTKAGGRPSSRSRFGRMGSLLVPGLVSPPGASRASATKVRLLSQSQLQMADASTGSAKSVLDTAVMAADVSDGDGGRQSWLFGTAPEVLLESAATDASPMQTMVSSLRSGLTAALSGATKSGSGEETRTLLMQELAAVRLGKVIGHGGQGVVVRGTLHGLETAVKVIAYKSEAAQGRDSKDVYEGDGDYSDVLAAKRGAMELVVTGALSHPNIVQVLASFSDVILARCTYRGDPSPRLRLFFKDDPVLSERSQKATLNTVVCLEYCDAGTLMAAARAGAFRMTGVSMAYGAVRPALTPLYMSLLEIALALRYLHSRRLVHCDLKPSNVLLRSAPRDPRGWNCKVSDFGCVQLMGEISVDAEEARRLSIGQQQLAASVGPNGTATVLGFRHNKPIGTILYMAPETFVKGRILGPAVDVYAFGIMMWELLTCRVLYEGVDVKDVPRLVAHHHLRPEFDPLAPLEYVHLAGRCWSAHASRRPTAAQLVCELEGLLEAAQRADERRNLRATYVVPSL